MPSLEKIAQTVLGVLLLVVLPLSGRPELLISWPVVVATIAGILIHIIPPSTPTSSLFHTNENDRGSTYFMMFAACSSFVLTAIDYAYIRKPNPPIASFWSIVGVGVIAFGLLIRQWTISTLGDYFTARVTLEAEHEMIDHGPYKYLRIRHPAYTGTLLIGLGIPIVMRSYWGLAYYGAVFLPAYLYRIYIEEMALKEKLGAVYATFSSKTRRLIPYLY